MPMMSYIASSLCVMSTHVIAVYSTCGWCMISIMFIAIEAHIVPSIMKLLLRDEAVTLHMHILTTYVCIMTCAWQVLG